MYKKKAHVSDARYFPQSEEVNFDLISNNDDDGDYVLIKTHDDSYRELFVNCFLHEHCTTVNYL